MPVGSDAALRLVLASVFLVFEHVDFELRRDHHQLFAHIPHRFGKQRLFAVLRAGFGFDGDIDDRFHARQVGRQRAIFLPRLAAAMSRDQVGFFDRFAEPVSGIGSFVGIAKVNPQLIWISDIAFALAAELVAEGLDELFLKLTFLFGKLAADVFLTEKL